VRHFIGGSVVVVCGLALSGTAWSQSKSLKDQLVGNWELVSVTEDYGNGKVEKAPFGESVKGSYDFDPTGRAMLMIIGDDLPPNPSRMPQESSRKVVAWFGKYTVDMQERP
jgi:hypothetical protein